MMKKTVFAAIRLAALILGVAICLHWIFGTGSGYQNDVVENHTPLLMAFFPSLIGIAVFSCFLGGNVESRFGLALVASLGLVVLEGCRIPVRSDLYHFFHRLGQSFGYPVSSIFIAVFLICSLWCIVRRKGDLSIALTIPAVYVLLVFGYSMDRIF